MNVVFTSALFLGSAAIACWFLARFPRVTLSMAASGGGAFLMTELLGRAPISSSSLPALYVSTFGIVLPMLVALWLCLLWLLKGLQETLGAMR